MSNDARAKNCDPEIEMSEQNKGISSSFFNPKLSPEYIKAALDVQKNILELLKHLELYRVPPVPVGRIGDSLDFNILEKGVEGKLTILSLALENSIKYLSKSEEVK